MKTPRAHVIHHTHWDPLWYFTKEDALVQFNHNFKEVLRGFKDKRITNFFCDGQSYAIDEYLKYHPEDKPLIATLIKEKRLMIGPFYNQIDCFITSGESMVQNLANGIDIANKLGGASHIAYLPDSFGHTIDFPKIFNHFDIHDFVITRGVGDEYNLDNEFYFQSPDGSIVLTAVMRAGYGYGTYPYKDGTLLTNQAKDYNKLDVHKLIKRLLNHTTLKNEFVFPLGFDQNPAIFNIDQMNKTYNEAGMYNFEQTTWKDYLKRVRQHGQNLKTHTSELYSTQHHRIHRSLFSARADIKGLQDKVERLLTYELQPLMSMVSELGLNYEHHTLKKAWSMLHEGQTHASATVSDMVNQQVKERTNSAYYLSDALKHHCMKMIATSMTPSSQKMPLVVFSPQLEIYKENIKMTVYTKHSDFSISYEDEEIPYTLLKQENIDGNVKTHTLKDDVDQWYVKSDIIMAHTYQGIGYDTFYISDELPTKRNLIKPSSQSIENQYYRITVNQGIHITSLTTGEIIHKALYLESVADQGDNYDFDYVLDDTPIIDDFEDACISESFESNTVHRITIKGMTLLPKDLQERKNLKRTTPARYTLSLELDNIHPTIQIKGTFDNQSNNHRIRLVARGNISQTVSEAGTQYGIIERACIDPAHNHWKKKHYFEEPTPTYPLLNFVSIKTIKSMMTIHSFYAKEYEVTGENLTDLGITLFRSVGHLGLPDLNRRPGRPSGLDNTIIKTPDSYMIGQQPFDIVMTLTPPLTATQRHKNHQHLSRDPLYYQNQPYQKVTPRIAYFPVNPLDEQPPLSFRFLLAEKCPSVFGTISKDVSTGTYDMRLFNPEERATNAHKLKYLKPTNLTNGLGQIISPINASFSLKPFTFNNVKLTD